VTSKPGESASTSPAPAPKGKIDRKEYLASKVPDAATMCHQQILATAKDPTSVQFADKYSYAFGRAITRNWIFITWNIMGRNTFGAVLKHEITCSVSCPPGKECSFINLEDQ